MIEEGKNVLCGAERLFPACANSIAIHPSFLPCILSVYLSIRLFALLCLFSIGFIYHDMSCHVMSCYVMSCYVMLLIKLHMNCAVHTLQYVHSLIISISFLSLLTLPYLRDHCARTHYHTLHTKKSTEITKDVN